MILTKEPTLREAFNNLEGEDVLWVKVLVREGKTFLIARLNESNH